MKIKNHPSINLINKQKKPHIICIKQDYLKSYIKQLDKQKIYPNRLHSG